MLPPHAVDIAVTISSLIASLCFTFVEPFDDMFLFVKWSCALEIQTKVYDPRKDRPIDRWTKQVNSRSLTKLLFRILQNSRKNDNRFTSVWERPFWVHSNRSIYIYKSSSWLFLLFLFIINSYCCTCSICHCNLPWNRNKWN